MYTLKKTRIDKVGYIYVLMYTHTRGGGRRGSMILASHAELIKY